MSEIRNNDILSVLYAVFRQKELPIIHWEDVQEDLHIHSLEPLTGSIINNIPPELRTSYEQICAQNVADSLRLYAIQAEVVEELYSRGITAVTLKGSSAAIYYPYPEYRTVGDIDLLVQHEDFDAAADHLKASGWKLVQEDYERHLTFVKDDEVLELHRYFCSEARVGKSENPSQRILDAVPRAERREVMGQAFFMLPPLENGLVLLEHIYHHIVSGLGLKQIIDWMLYVHAELDDAAWNGGFADAVREAGTERLAKVVTRAAQMYLGLPEENCTWCMDAKPEVCERFMEHILQSGNFGRKKDHESRNEAAIMNHLRRAPLERLQTSGLHNWKAAQRYAILRPFAWLYQLFRYARQGLSRKGGLRAVLADSRESRGEAKLFAQLGLEGYEKYE